MDHLDLDPSLYLNLLPVPLYMDFKRQLNSDFHTFDSGSQDIVLVGTRLIPNPDRPLQRPPTSNKLKWIRDQHSAFLQGWLFFEVLRAILGHLPEWNINDFTRPGDDGRRCIITKALPWYLEKWLNYELKHPDESLPRLLNAQLVLDKARHYVFEFCSVSAPDGQPNWTTIDDKVIVSIMILGETMSSALTKIQRRTRISLRGWSDHDDSRQGWGYNQVVLRSFRQKPGWCLKTVAILQGVMRNSTIGLLYTLRMRPQERLDMDHSLCTKTECKATCKGYPVELEKPEPFHCPNCNTEVYKEVETDTQDLVKIIDQGQIPLLQYQPSAGKINVFEMDASCSKEYVIFSHI